MDQGTIDQPTIHGTGIRLEGQGLLIRGASGAGKSRLALALLADAGCWPQGRSETPQELPPTLTAPTALIGDDRLIIESRDGRAVASPPPTLAGLMEVRGIGLLAMRWCGEASLDLVVELKPLAECKRLPEPEETTIAGSRLPVTVVPEGDLAHQVLLVGVARRLLSG